MNKNIKNQNLVFSIVIEKDSNGYFAECRELQGCYAQGETYEEVMENIKEVIGLHVEDRIDRADFAVQPSGQSQISFTTFSLAIPHHAV